MPSTSVDNEISALKVKERWGYSPGLFPPGYIHQYLNLNKKLGYRRDSARRR